MVVVVVGRGEGRMSTPRIRCGRRKLIVFAREILSRLLIDASGEVNRHPSRSNVAPAAGDVGWALCMDSNRGDEWALSMVGRVPTVHLSVPTAYQHTS